LKEDSVFETQRIAASIGIQSHVSALADLSSVEEGSVLETQRVAASIGIRSHASTLADLPSVTLLHYSSMRGKRETRSLNQ
jgi:hypothetical protein